MGGGKAEKSPTLGVRNDIRAMLQNTLEMTSKSPAADFR